MGRIGPTDEAFQGFPNVEIPALRALLRTYLDMLAYPRVRLKLFARNDLFRKVIQGGFVNLTHVNARKIEIVWEEDDLLSLFCRRVRDSEKFIRIPSFGSLSDKELFDRIFPKQIDQGSRKPTTWVWMMSRIRDGNGIKPPRNLIDLAIKSKEAQMRSNVNPRAFSPGTPVVEADSVRRAHRALSEQRVQDTLLAEAAELTPMIEKFRDGKAEHNTDSLRKLLEVSEHSVRSTIKPLIEMGFLEEIGASSRSRCCTVTASEITQGKAFSGGNDSGDDET